MTCSGERGNKSQGASVWFCLYRSGNQYDQYHLDAVKTENVNNFHCDSGDISESLLPNHECFHMAAAVQSKNEVYNVQISNIIYTSFKNPSSGQSTPIVKGGCMKICLIWVPLVIEDHWLSADVIVC